MGALPIGLPVFLVAGSISLVASWILVSRIERLGTHFAISGALLGLIAALAADSPEITSAITAFGHHQGTVGAGVVLGSNVFNLAALLGLSALLAGWVELHRRVVLLSGSVALWVAGISLLVIVGPLSATAGLLLVFAVLAPYTVLLGMRRAHLQNLPLPERWQEWLVRAIREEGSEAAEAQPQRAFGRHDLWVVTVSLLVVVGASVAMERAASAIGARYAISNLVIGALVLAGVTSLPNAVSASYLALRGHGAATLSTALNSNTLNVMFGFLLPAAILGIATGSEGGPLVASFYVGLTAVSLLLAYLLCGLNRAAATVIIAVYLVFVGLVLASAGLSSAWLGLGLALCMAAVLGVVIPSIRGTRAPGAERQTRRDGSEPGS
jgi:cation:H+ antiporter